MENEEVVNYALKRRHVKLVDIEIDVGEPGYTKYVDKRYHPDTARTRRIFPHVHNMDGFYVAKFVKVANGAKVVEGEDEGEGEYVGEIEEEVEEVEKKPKGDRIKTKKIVKNKKQHDKVQIEEVSGRTERNAERAADKKKSFGKKFDKDVRKKQHK